MNRTIPYLFVLIIAISLLPFYCNSKNIPDWAKFNRYSVANSQISKTPDVVFMGNSITDFWIRDDSTFFTSNNYLDRGISGQTTAEMLVRFRADVINLHPKVVVIKAGINDIAGNNGDISMGNIMGNIISMVELAEKNNIQVVLCNLLPCAYFSWQPELNPIEKVNTLNQMIENYAKNKSIEFVDYNSAFNKGDGTLHKEFSNDGCHPNLKAYKIMETIVTPKIKNALKRSSK